MIFTSKYQHCKANLSMNIKGKRNKFHSCSKVEKNSSLRDDIKESYHFEILLYKK